MDDVYTQNIIEHAKHPKHFGVLDGADAVAEAANPGCGDTLTLFVKWDASGCVEDVRFDGAGCAISMAASSMFTEAMIGKSKEELKMMSPGDVYSLLGIEISPGRTQCALLCYGALEEMLRKL